MERANTRFMSSMKPVFNFSRYSGSPSTLSFTTSSSWCVCVWREGGGERKVGGGKGMIGTYFHTCNAILGGSGDSVTHVCNLKITCTIYKLCLYAQQQVIYCVAHRMEDILDKQCLSL